MEEAENGQPKYVRQTCARDLIEKQLGANIRDPRGAQALVQAAQVLLSLLPQGGAIQFSVKSGRVIALAGGGAVGAPEDFLFVVRVPVLAGIGLQHA